MFTLVCKESYEAAGGRAYTCHSLPRTSPSAFIFISILWCAQVGLDAFERTEHYSACVKMLQHIRNLEEQQRTFKSMSKEEYHDPEQMMTAEERVLAQYLLVRLCGAAETRARVGI